MDAVELALAISFIATVMLLPMGMIRVLAYRSGTDNSRGMRGLARVTLGAALVAALCLVTLTVIVANR